MTIPTPVNEPVQAYAPGSAERASIKAALAAARSEQPELPFVIGGRDVRSGDLRTARMPHARHETLATWHAARSSDVEQAIDAALGAHAGWAALTLEQRAAVFLRAADLIAGPWRDRINAATMLGQSKTVHQAEIDAACELVDFLRFNARFAQEIEAQQPISSPGMWNRLEYRPLEGFIFAVSPFNFTAIAGNLPSSVALMGNVVVWKPASTAVVAAHVVMRVFQAAGLPDGVINLVPGDASAISGTVLGHPAFAGIHFTGSTEVFNSIWKTVGDNIGTYRSYPRLVGETGGKDFILAHASADVEALAVAIVRGGFEYQGQKCSAASRVYVPDTLWDAVSERVGDIMSRVRMGDPSDFSNFLGAVIDENAFRRLSGAIAMARESPDAEIVHGGGYDDSEGWFIEPTIIRTTDPSFDLMQRELFGPVVTTYVYPAKRYAETIELVDRTSPYALTGAVFADERAAVEQASAGLRFAAGNFYVNDKPTGAVVGQQPFGGARASGTNDKAGSPLNLVRWTSARSVKETFAPPHDFAYPFMEPEVKPIESGARSA
jgi:1-pyrroline-5-carboxylate dehydrogenase